MKRIEVTATTMGQSNPSHVAAGKYYKFRGDPDWVPNDARYRETIPAHQLAGGAERAARRERRIDAFAVALAGLGVTDPANAANTAVIAAGRIVGVGEKTAKSYRTALRKRQPRGEARDG